MIIPPSSLAVLLGSLARIDVGGLLIAGLIPGLILMALYVAVIRISIALDPDAAPSYDVDRPPLTTILRTLAVNVLPMSLVVFSVIGLILLGWATPTESAAFGAVSVGVLALCYGKLSVEVLMKALMGTLKVSGMMLMIIIGSTTFSQLLAFSGASSGMISFATGFDLGHYGMLAAMLAVLIVLGMFMDQLSIMMLTLPIFIPLTQMYGIDPVWFGVAMAAGAGDEPGNAALRPAAVCHGGRGTQGHDAGPDRARRAALPGLFDPADPGPGDLARAGHLAAGHDPLARQPTGSARRK